MKKKISVGLLQGMMLLMLLSPMAVYAGAAMEVGSSLPNLSLTVPTEEQDKGYLGLGEGENFSVSDIDAQLVLFEVLGVFCPKCHIQHPLFNKLYFRIKKDPELSGKVKFLGLAAGATPMEVAYVKKKNRIPFPIITDPKYEIHKLLGEPRTPFTMIIRKDGTIAFTHLGVIKDMDELLQKIKNMLP